MATEALSIKKEHLPVIQRLARDHKPLYDADWLDSGNPSVGFLICIAQGPWKQDRRFRLAEKAIVWLMRTTAPEVDLGRVTLDVKAIRKLFPLKWQCDYLINMSTRLIERNILMRHKYDDWLTQIIQGDRDVWQAIVREVFDMCGAKPNGSKVLWMFCRDVLRVPAFTIDRWVARHLREHGLPTNPWYMTRACLLADVDPNELSRGLFSVHMLNEGMNG